MRPALALLALFVCGCPHAPIDFGPRGRITDPEIALEAVRARRAKTTKAQGEAKANITTPEGAGHISQYIVAERPNRLHIESISFFNNPVAVVASDGEHFQLLDLENKRFFEGLATPGNIGRFVQVALPPDELVSLLVGVPPLVEPAETMTLDVDEKERVYVLRLGRGSTQEAIGLDPVTLRPKFVAYADRIVIAPYRAELDNYEGALDLPKTVRLSGGKISVELTWKDREEDPEIDPGVFHLDAPPDVERVKLP